MDRARLILLNAALGPLDYRVPAGMRVEPGSIVVAPLGPRQVVGVAWEPERLPAEAVGDNRLRPLLHAYALPPLPAPPDRSRCSPAPVPRLVDHGRPLAAWTLAHSSRSPNRSVEVTSIVTSEACARMSVTVCTPGRTFSKLSSTSRLRAAGR